MSKSIIIFDTPDNCDTCPICVAVLGKRYCPIKGTNISKGERDCSCPAVAVPEKIDPTKAASPFHGQYIQGWNSCVDKLLGGTDE